MTYIELPSLHMLPSIFACDHDDKFGYLAPNHPLVQLRHDLFYIRLDLVIGRY